MIPQRVPLLEEAFALLGAPAEEEDEVEDVLFEKLSLPLPYRSTGAFFVPSVASPLTMDILEWTEKLASQVNHLRNVANRLDRQAAP
jgi:hypothetical protein